MNENNGMNDNENIDTVYDELDILQNNHVFTEACESTDSTKIKKFIRQNPDKIISAAVLALACVSLIFAAIFWVMSKPNSVVMFAVFSCCVSCYGFYLSMKNFKE